MSALRKGWCPGALRPMAAKDGLLVRLRLTGGILPAATAHAIADLAARYGNGRFDLTARANLQMRGVREASLPALQNGLRTLGLLDVNAAAESVRNVIASPLAGLHDGPDIRPLVEALERRLAEDTALHALPGKFGFLLDDGSWPTLAGVEADVRFDWEDERFAVSLGGTRDVAVPIGSCTAAELVECAGAIATQALALLAQHPEARRMRHLVAALAPRDLAKEFGRGLEPAACDGGAFKQQDLTRNVVGFRRLDVSAPLPLVGRGKGWGSMPRFTDESEAPHKPPPLTPPPKGEGKRQHRGLFCLGIAAPFGRLDAAMLRDAAALACRSPFQEIRLTPWRTLFIPGIDRLDGALPGFITNPGDPRLAVAACVGIDGCAQGTTDTQADAAVLADALAPGDDITLHVSGCEKGCAKVAPSPITLVARDGRYDLVRDGRAGDPPVRRGLDLAAARAAIIDAMRPA